MIEYENFLNKLPLYILFEMLIFFIFFKADIVGMFVFEFIFEKTKELIDTKFILDILEESILKINTD